MKQLYRDQYAILYQGDCIEGMKKLEAESIDLVVTSPPYNVGKNYDIEFGNYLKMLADFYFQTYYLVKKGKYCVVNFANNWPISGSKKYQSMEYLHLLLAGRAGWTPQVSRIWVKDFATLDDKYSINTLLPKQEWEFILVCRKGGGKEKIRETEIHSRGVWSTAGKHQARSTVKMHTSGFPESLVSMILQVYSDEMDIVLDPFCGSGTTIIVAKLMQRRGVGFELDEKFAEIARERISQQVLATPGITRLL